MFDSTASSSSTSLSIHRSAEGTICLRMDLGDCNTLCLQGTGFFVRVESSFIRAAWDTPLPMTNDGSDQWKAYVLVLNPKDLAFQVTVRWPSGVFQWEEGPFHTAKDMLNLIAAAPDCQFKEESTEAVNIDKLPKELLQHIFSFLPLPDQGRAARVCKNWNANASSVLEKRKYPNIDADVWKKYVNLEEYGLSFDGLSVPDETVLRQEARDLGQHVESGHGASIIAIPRGLSLTKMLAIAKASGMPVRYTWDKVVPAIGAVETERADVAVVSNSILKRSRKKSVYARDVLVQTIEYEVPSTKELLTVMFFHYVMHSDRLFGDKPWTFSLTSDLVDRWRLGIGGFAASGFLVSRYGDGDFGDGVAVVRKF